MGVDGGGAVARSITELVGADRAGGAYDAVVATKDWHIDPGSHFATGDAEPDFVDTWPVHCVADTHGAALHEGLDVELDETFLKGRFTASYTGFDGKAASDDTLLGDWLDDRGTTAVDVVGLATDYCVKATALDALKAGLDTTVLLAHCAGVAPETTAVAIEELRAAGATVVDV